MALVAAVHPYHAQSYSFSQRNENAKAIKQNLAKIQGSPLTKNQRALCDRIAEVYAGARDVPHSLLTCHVLMTTCRTYPRLSFQSPKEQELYCNVLRATAQAGAAKAEIPVPPYPQLEESFLETFAWVYPLMVDKGFIPGNKVDRTLYAQYKGVDPSDNKQSC
jgi:hypothetical protein